MKTFLIKASYVVYVEADIEAKDEKEAWKIAKKMDGGLFTPESQDDWHIDNVIEIETEEL